MVAGVRLHARPLRLSHGVVASALWAGWLALLAVSALRVSGFFNRQSAKSLARRLSPARVRWMPSYWKNTPGIAVRGSAANARCRSQSGALSASATSRAMST